MITINIRHEKDMELDCDLRTATEVLALLNPTPAGIFPADLNYWIGVTDCTCDSDLPQGACLRCDLEKIRDAVTSQPLPGAVK